MRKKPESYTDSIARIFPDLVSPGKKVRTITLQVTEDCNLRCTYCYQTEKAPRRMSYETATAFLTALLDNRVPGFTTEETAGVVLEFIGGEPFLEIELIRQVSDWFVCELLRRWHPWRNFFRFSISTNGTLYFQDKVQEYLRRYRKWVSLSISVDGDQQLHDCCRVFPDGSGSYRLASAAARDWITKSDGVPSTKATLSPDNVAYTARAVQGLIELGFRIIYINCVYEEGWTVAHARTLYRQMKLLGRWLIDSGAHRDVYIRLFEEDLFRPIPESETQNYCGGTGEMLAVDWRGHLYPCLRYMPSSLGEKVPPLVVGHLQGGRVSVTVQEREFLACLRSVTRQSQSSEECLRCPIAAGCAWCSAYNYQCGDVNTRQTHICWMHRARALANFEFWSEYCARFGGPAPICYVPEEWAAVIRGED